MFDALTRRQQNAIVCIIFTVATVRIGYIRRYIITKLGIQSVTKLKIKRITIVEAIEHIGITVRWFGKRHCVQTALKCCVGWKAEGVWLKYVRIRERCLHRYEKFTTLVEIERMTEIVCCKWTMRYEFN